MLQLDWYEYSSNWEKTISKYLKYQSSWYQFQDRSLQGLCFANLQAVTFHLWHYNFWEQSLSRQRSSLRTSKIFLDLWWNLLLYWKLCLWCCNSHIVDALRRFPWIWQGTLEQIHLLIFHFLLYFVAFLFFLFLAGSRANALEKIFVLTF